MSLEAYKARLVKLAGRGDTAEEISAALLRSVKFVEKTFDLPYMNATEEIAVVDGTALLPSKSVWTVWSDDKLLIPLDSHVPYDAERKAAAYFWDGDKIYFSGTIERCTVKHVRFTELTDTHWLLRNAEDLLSALTLVHFGEITTDRDIVTTWARRVGTETAHLYKLLETNENARVTAQTFTTKLRKQTDPKKPDYVLVGGPGRKGDTGGTGGTGPKGADSVVPGPPGTEPGPPGPASTVPGPEGPASTVPGPIGGTGDGFRRIYLTLGRTEPQPPLPHSYIGSGTTLTAVNGTQTWQTVITDPQLTEQVWFIDLEVSTAPSPFHTPNGEAALLRGDQGPEGDSTSKLYVAIANGLARPMPPNVFTNNAGVITGTASGQPPSFSSVGPIYDENTHTLWSVDIVVDGQTGHISVREPQATRVNGKQGLPGLTGPASTVAGPSGGSIWRLYISTPITSGIPDRLETYFYNAEVQSLAGFSNSANWGTTFPQESALLQTWFVDIRIPGGQTTGTYVFTVGARLLRGPRGEKGDAGDGVFGSPKEQKRTYQVGNANPQTAGAYAIEYGTGSSADSVWIRFGFPAGDEAVAKNLVDSAHTLWAGRTDPLENQVPLAVENADGGGKRYYNSSSQSGEIWVAEFRFSLTDTTIESWLATAGETNFYFVGDIDPTADTALEEAEIALLLAGAALTFIRRPREWVENDRNRRLRPNQNGGLRSLYWVAPNQFYLLPNDDDFDLLTRLGETGGSAFDKAIFGARDIRNGGSDVSEPTRRWELSIASVEYVTEAQRNSRGNWILFTMDAAIDLNLATENSAPYVVLSFEFEDASARAIESGRGAFFGRLNNDFTNLPSATNHTARLQVSGVQNIIQWGLDATDQAVFDALDFQIGDSYQIIGFDENHAHIQGAFYRENCADTLTTSGGRIAISCARAEENPFPAALLGAHFVSINLFPGSALLGRTEVIAETTSKNALGFFGENKTIAPTRTSNSVRVQQTSIDWSTTAVLNAAMLGSGFAGEDELLVSAYDVNRKLRFSEFIESDEGSIESSAGGGSLTFTRRTGHNPTLLLNAAWVDVKLLPGGVRRQVAYAASQSDPLHIVGKQRDSTPHATLQGIYITNSTLIQFSASSAKQGAIIANGIVAGSRVEITAQDRAGDEVAIELRDIVSIDHESGHTAIRFNVSSAALPAPFYEAEVLSLFLRAPGAASGDYVAALAARSDPLHIVGDRISVTPSASNQNIAIGGAGASILWYGSTTDRAYLRASGFKAGDAVLIRGWDGAGAPTGSIIKFAESPIVTTRNDYLTLNFTAEGGTPPAGVTAAVRLTVLFLPTPRAVDTTRYDTAYTRSQADNYLITGPRVTSGAPSSSNPGIQIASRSILFYANPRQRTSILASSFSEGDLFELGIVSGGNITTLHVGRAGADLATGVVNYLTLTIPASASNLPGAFFGASVSELSLRLIPAPTVPDVSALVTRTELGDTIPLSMASANSPTRFTGRKVANVSDITGNNDSIDLNSTGSAIRYSAHENYARAILASGIAAGDYLLLSSVTSLGFLSGTQRIKITSIDTTNANYIQFNTAPNAYITDLNMSAETIFLSVELLPGTNLDWILRRQWGGTGGEVYAGTHSNPGVEIGYDAEAVRWNIFEVVRGENVIHRSRPFTWLPETGTEERFVQDDIGSGFSGSINLRTRPNVGTSPLTKNRVSFDSAASATRFYRLYSRN